MIMPNISHEKCIAKMTMIKKLMNILKNIINKIYQLVLLVRIINFYRISSTIIMILLVLLVSVLVAQPIVRPPFKTNATPYIQTGKFNIVGTGFITTTLTFGTPQPDAQYKFLLSIEEIYLMLSGTNYVHCWTNGKPTQTATNLIYTSNISNTNNNYILRYLIISSKATNIQGNYLDYPQNDFNFTNGSTGVYTGTGKVSFFAEEFIVTHLGFNLLFYSPLFGFQVSNSSLAVTKAASDYNYTVTIIYSSLSSFKMKQVHLFIILYTRKMTPFQGPGLNYFMTVETGNFTTYNRNYLATLDLDVNQSYPFITLRKCNMTPDLSFGYLATHSIYNKVAFLSISYWTYIQFSFLAFSIYVCPNQAPFLYQGV